jgi:hypothetical protein
MANTKSGKRRSGIVALVAVIAAFAVPSVASANPGKSKNAERAPVAVVEPAVTQAVVPASDLSSDVAVEVASWADASWADASWADASWAE